MVRKTRKKAAKKAASKKTTAKKPAVKKTVKKAAKKTVARKAGAPLSKSQLMAVLAEATEIPKKDVVNLMEQLAAIAYKEAKNGFTLPGFGKLALVKRKARMGRNPQTGESIKIPAKTVVKFRIAKACKDAILGKK